MRDFVIGSKDAVVPDGTMRRVRSRRARLQHQAERVGWGAGQKEAMLRRRAPVEG